MVIVDTLIFYLRGKPFNLSLISMILALNLAYWPLLYWVILLLYAISFSVFIMNECCMFNAFLHALRLSYDFIFHSINVMCHIYLFVCFESFLPPMYESHIIILCDPFNLMFKLICLYFLENFYIYLSQILINISFFIFEFSSLALVSG